jgi:membrane-associated protease RseP (regulator of RpoE activity)
MLCRKLAHIVSLSLAGLLIIAGIPPAFAQVDGDDDANRRRGFDTRQRGDQPGLQLDRDDRDVRDRFDRGRRPPGTNGDQGEVLPPRRERGTNEGTEDGRPEIQLVPPRDDPWRPGPPRESSWWLGVYAYNTSTGVRVTRVVPDSPAWDAGLESGDRIVTVDGYQVGYVNGRLYSLGEELDRSAGPRGGVTLLVQNRRNGRLVNVEADLERRRR